MKKFVFILLVISVVGYIGFSLVYNPFSFDTSLDNRLLSLRTHIAMLEVIGLYIAWRVTP